MSGRQRLQATFNSELAKCILESSASGLRVDLVEPFKNISVAPKQHTEKNIKFHYE